MAFVAHWDKARHDLNFAIDGIVIKVNRYDHQKRLGNTAKSPRWALAYKFETERARTELVDVKYQVGRTGAVTPVADLDPVQLGGTTVQHASLHNADQIAKLDLRIGDMVFVEKGGRSSPRLWGWTGRPPMQRGCLRRRRWCFRRPVQNAGPPWNASRVRPSITA